MMTMFQATTNEIDDGFLFCPPCDNNDHRTSRNDSIDDESGLSMKVSMEMVLSVLGDDAVPEKARSDDTVSSCNTSLSSLDSFRTSSPMTRAFDRIETNKKQRRACRFFRSKKGCRAGANCRFEHSS